MEKQQIIKQFEDIENTIASLCSNLELLKNSLSKKVEFFESCMENAVEIGQIAALLERDGKIIVEDGKELTMTCVEIAKKFEEQYDPEGGDYYGEIDAFASPALVEEFGAEKDPEPSFIKSDEAYRTYMHTPCYVIDKEGAWSHSQLLALVQGDDVLCGIMFDNLNGEKPSEFINYNIKCQLWMKCEACGRIFTAYDNNVTECAHCHTLLPGDVHFDEAVDKELGYK